MALFIPGMRCSISNEQIDTVEDAVIFPPFVANEADPIYVFSDAVVKAEVFRAHPLAAKAQARYEEFQRRTRPQARICMICGQPITNPDDYLALGYLVEDPADGLYPYNYAHFHRSSLAAWKGLPALIEKLERLERSGSWKGSSLQRAIDDLSSLRPADNVRIDVSPRAQVLPRTS